MAKIATGRASGTAESEQTPPRQAIRPRKMPRWAPYAKREPQAPFQLVSPHRDGPPKNRALVRIRLARRRQALRRSVFLLGQQFERSTQASLVLRRNVRSGSISGGSARASASHARNSDCAAAISSRRRWRAESIRESSPLHAAIASILESSVEFTLQPLAVVEQRAQLDVFRFQLVGLGAFPASSFTPSSSRFKLGNDSVSEAARLISAAMRASKAEAT